MKLNVNISIAERVIATCDYLLLEVHAPSTARSFSFKNISLQNSLGVEPEYEIKVLILGHDKLNRERLIADFSMSLIDFGDLLDKQDWWVYGLIHHDNMETYRQGVIDVMHAWYNGKSFDWFEQSINSSLKADYITACQFWSSLSTDVISKESYSLDMSLVKEEQDLYYLIAQEFIGDKGYMGHSYNAFLDCMLTLYHHRGYFIGNKIIFSNIDKIEDEEITALYKDVKDVFKRYKFAIVEENIF